MLKGIAASAGISIGKAVVIQSAEIKVVKRTVQGLDEEKARFLDAVEVFVAELEEAQNVVSRNVGESEAAIIGTQIAIIRDPELIKEVLRTIERQRVNAEYAFYIICNGYIAMFSHIEDELLSARAADFKDIRDRMMRILLGICNVNLSHVPEDSILVAEDIPPSEAGNIDMKRIKGILTQKGTRFSHIAIIARALQLPAVVSVEEVFDHVKGGETLIVDGYNGLVMVNPGKTKLDEYRMLFQAEQRRKIELSVYRDRPTQTADGRKIQLAANLAVEQELSVISEYNADGIGLFRTEFLFMDRASVPSEEEQFAVYQHVAKAMSGRTVTIRTLDVGGDKDIPYLFENQDPNPYLGYRGIRFCLNRPDVFCPQLAALLRAARFGNLRILLPMVSTISELRRARELIARAMRELEQRSVPFQEEVPLGIMIETPAAVLCAEELARESDFFSIGTNDLTQYVMAVDRGNSKVSDLYDTLHPAVLRMVHKAVEAANQAGVPLGVCGESAADPLFTPILIGMGVRELSVNSGSILAVRRFINSLSFREWTERIPVILAMETATEVRRYMLNHVEYGTG